MGLIEVVMGKKLCLRDKLIGQQVLVNDQDGDAYQGLLVAFDDSMVRLEQVGAVPVRFVDGKSKHVIELGPWANVPASQVKFVVEAPA